MKETARGRRPGIDFRNHESEFSEFFSDSPVTATKARFPRVIGGNRVEPPFFNEESQALALVIAGQASAFARSFRVVPDEARSGLAVLHVQTPHAVKKIRILVGHKEPFVEYATMGSFTIL